MADDPVDWKDWTCRDVTANFTLTPVKAITFQGDRDWAVRIDWTDGWTVEVNQGLDWDGAAKLFWNSVAKLVGQPPPFGW